MLPPNLKDFFNPPRSHRPLTTQRVQHLLDAMSRFEGVPFQFGQAAHRARMAKAAPGYLPASSEFEVFDPDPSELAEDHERLMLLWRMSHEWEEGGPRDARARIDARLRELEELRTPVPGMMARSIDAENDEQECSHGGPYADGIRVHFPRDPAFRHALFKIVAREARSEGFDPEPDTGQESVFLWWD